MKNFNEGMRFEYPLTTDSLIVDAGGHEGNWFMPMWERYHCNIMVFEPVMDFYLKCSQRAYGDNHDVFSNTKIAVFNSALGARECDIPISVQGDSSGIYGSGETQQLCIVRDVRMFSGINDWAVLKLNIEGMEFDVIERLIETSMVSRVENIQVQFHRCVPNFEKRYAELRSKLLLTHEPEWDSEPVWQNWKKR